MIAIEYVANNANRTCANGTFDLKNPARALALVLAAGIAALALAGCGALPDKPARAALYDFGPGLLSAAPAPTPAPTPDVPAAAIGPGTNAAGAAAPTPALPPIVLPEIDANARLDGTQLLYRLGYADANELRPYGQSRWSLPPAQLLRQRLRDALAQRRTVLDPQEAATLARNSGGQAPTDTLRVSLEEFSHYFDTPTSSVGLVRLRATLVRAASGGDRVLGQRVFTVRRPAPSADAAGGVKALAAASDAVVGEAVRWVEQGW